MTDDTTTTLTIAHQAFQSFTQGLETGHWDEFLDWVTEDFTFWFPVGPYHGLNVGKDRAVEFLHYVSQTFPQGLTVQLDGVTSNTTTAVFELRSQGLMGETPYKNRITIAFDVRGDKICAYREYFGSDGKSY